MHNLKIEFKIILSIIIFTIVIGGIDRYQLSHNLITQFIKSQESKNQLLADTIIPVIAMNMSLGLDASYKEYLDQIKKQNNDIKHIIIQDNRGKILYSNPKVDSFKRDTSDQCTMKNSYANVIDPLLNKKIAYLTLEFYNHDYNVIVSKNRVITFQLAFVLFVLLVIYVLIIRVTFKELRELTKNVLEYDPKLNNFPLTQKSRFDEIGIIHTAIITMVKKIKSYATILDEMNASLEQKVKLRTAELEEANKKLKALSTIDPLTQIYNRRYLNNYLDKLWNLSKRSQLNLSIIMCDIDFFKKVNDTYGHQLGDEVLAYVSKTIKKSLKRSTEIVARYGGEEFIIVMPDAKPDEAELLCKEIAKDIKENNNLKVNGQKIEPFTLSFGISNTTPAYNADYSDLIHKADKALYQAKANGRDCIVSNPN